MVTVNGLGGEAKFVLQGSNLGWYVSRDGSLVCKNSRSSQMNFSGPLTKLKLTDFYFIKYELLLWYLVTKNALGGVSFFMVGTCNRAYSMPESLGQILKEL